MKTIAVNDKIWQKLRQLKEKKGLTFEDVIEDILFRAEKTPRSMFGAAKGMKPFTRKEREEMWHDNGRN